MMFTGGQTGTGEVKLKPEIEDAKMDRKKKWLTNKKNIDSFTDYHSSN